MVINLTSLEEIKQVKLCDGDDVIPGGGEADASTADVGLCLQEAKPLQVSRAAPALGSEG